jgi:phospholipid/cholesterol/gamma-HCH transport system substrate-binding protein
MNDQQVNTRNTIVGLIVVAIVCVITIFIVWFSSGVNSIQYSTYIIYSTESVSGLSEDSDVEFNGVDVGKVNEIQISKKNPKLVKIRLNIKSGTPITKSTVATLATNSFVTGISYVSLTDIGVNFQPLMPLEGEVYPVIPSRPSTTARLDTTMTQLKNNFSSIVSVARTSFNSQDLLLIKHTGYNLDVFMKIVKANSQNVSLTYDNIIIAKNNFAPILIYKKRIMDLLEIQLLPTMYELVANTEKTYDTLNEVRKIIKDHPSVLVRGLAPAPPGPGETKNK